MMQDDIGDLGSELTSSQEATAALRNGASDQSVLQDEYLHSQAARRNLQSELGRMHADLYDSRRQVAD